MVALDVSAVRIGGTPSDKAQAIRQVGEILVKSGNIEPGYIERKFGRVPKLAGGASRLFTLDDTILFGSEDVSAVAREISAIQGQRKTQVDAQPQALPDKN